MLEQGNSLKTFRLNLPPQDIQATPALALPIADHEMRFLSYEGPVNRGQGSVRIVEQGHYQTLSQRSSSWGLSLDGTILKGRFKIAQLENGSWQFQPVPV